MATTDFTNGVTLTDADWFNDADFLIYDLFGDSTTTASAASRLTPSIRSLDHTTGVLVTGTLSVSAQATLAGVTVGGVLSTSATAAMQGVQVGGTLSVSAGVAGAAVATQANMESAASTGSTSLIVTPGRMQFHPASAKAWARFNGAATSVTASASYNVSSITDVGTGQYRITYTTPMSSDNYPVSVTIMTNTDASLARTVSVSAAAAMVLTSGLEGTAVDSSAISFIAFGDL